MERWTVFLAEVEIQQEEAGFLAERLPGVVRIAPRLWLWPDWAKPEEERRAVPLGEHPTYGRVYARPIARGEGLEALHASPLWGEVNAYVRSELVKSLVRGSRKATELLDLAKTLGMEEAIKEAEATVNKAKTATAFLSLVGAPHRLADDGKIIVGEDCTIALEEVEEAQLVARAYQWAKQHRMTIRPLGRGAKGELRFFAPIARVQVENGKAVMPYRGRQKNTAYVVLTRGADGKNTAEDVNFRLPKKVSLLFL